MTKDAARPRIALDFQRPLVTVDVVIFSVIDDVLKVLLVRRPAADDSSEPFPGRWALPGGFIDVTKDTSLEACAQRKLQEKTGVNTPYLEQLASWGGADRDPRGWSVTHAYFALIPAQDLVLETGANATAVEWVDAEAALRKRLAFDHAEILGAALARLRSKVEYTSLPAYLLASPFTLPQLQRMYELVRGKPTDKSAFRTRMLDADFLVEAGQIEGPLGRRPMAYFLKDRSQPAVFPRTFSPRNSGA